jgi:hypothetical protein
LLRSELTELNDDPRFTVRAIEPISGFNTNKGKVQELEFAIVQASTSSLARSVEQLHVK